jgi:hypothetical protein
MPSARISSDKISIQMSLSAILTVTFLRLTGPGPVPLTPAHAGRLVQFGALSGGVVRGRILEFNGANTAVRDFKCAWAQLEPLVKLLDELCSKTPDVRDVLDTPPTWEQITLEASWNGRHCSVHLTLGVSGFEGPDALLLRSFLTRVEELVQA